jgi:hypothetical protein
MGEGQPIAPMPAHAAGHAAVNGTAGTTAGLVEPTTSAFGDTTHLLIAGITTSLLVSDQPKTSIRV